MVEPRLHEPLAHSHLLEFEPRVLALACNTPHALCTHVCIARMGHLDCPSRRIPSSSTAAGMGRTTHFVVVRLLRESGNMLIPNREF
jgi:hypothetical protein